MLRYIYFDLIFIKIIDSFLLIMKGKALEKALNFSSIYYRRIY